MDRVNSRIAQVYGYAVCFICVIVILVSTHQVIDSAFDYANPAGADAMFGDRYGSPASFTTYKMDMRRQMTIRGPGQTVSDSLPSDAELRKIFTAEHQQRLDAARFRAKRLLVSGIVFIILATVLFLLHWRWIRGTSRDDGAVSV